MFVPLFNVIFQEQHLGWCPEAYNPEAIRTNKTFFGGDYVRDMK